MRRKTEIEIPKDTVSGRTTSVSLWVPFVAEQFCAAPKRCARNSSQLISANSKGNVNKIVYTGGIVKIRRKNYVIKVV